MGKIIDFTETRKKSEVLMEIICLKNLKKGNRLFTEKSSDNYCY